METVTVIGREHIRKSIDYARFEEMMQHWVENKSTSGPNQSESMAHYTKLNWSRMRRLDKQSKINTSLAKKVEAIEGKQVWLVLVEGWCGDVAQNLPVIQKMVELNPNIELRMIFRDENLDVMDAYLTNGGRSIPKLIAMDADSLEELWTWGPRPAPVQEMVEEYKKTGGPYSEFSEKVQKWYNGDKTQTLQNEFEALI